MFCLGANYPFNFSWEPQAEMRNHLLFGLKIMGSGIILIMASRSVKRMFSSVLICTRMWEPDVVPTYPLLPAKPQGHPQPCFPHRAAPFAPFTLSQVHLRWAEMAPLGGTFMPTTMWLS